MPRPYTQRNRTQFGSKNSVSVQLIRAHYQDHYLTRGMTVDQAMDIARDLKLGIYELCALANFHELPSLTGSQPTNGLVDRALSMGHFPPTVALHFKMFQNSFRMLKGEQPDILVPIYLVDSGRELEEMAKAATV